MEGRTRIHITGIVQGVGFRPFVFNLANKYRLNGFCLNDSEGVIVEVEGEEVDAFINEIRSSPPPLSRIETIITEALPGSGAYKGFVIRESVLQEGKSAMISPDMATCPDCMRELLDHKDRRYRYPFINCTNCGPRYSIVLDIPYDRPKTTMAPFNMCVDCEREYRDPSNRRFHAQPNACPVCGPNVWLKQRVGEDVVSDHSAVQKAVMLLRDGAILAIKGLGGFHLCCDAANNDAVRRLRDRKRRSNKPFAIMSPDAETAGRFCSVSEDERELLEGITRPIVLLERLSSDLISDAVAPGSRTLGVMLPYTPLHHLLFNSPDKRFTALVMTSGNLADEPIVVSNNEAVERLSGIADHFLLHDREIYMRVDDSIVAQVPGSTSILLRRSRGFAPAPFLIGEEMADILACGAELKSTFCLTKGKSAILSQHIGDLTNYEALEFYKESLKNLKNSFRAGPVIIAHDMHPDYLSTKFAHEYAALEKIAEEMVMPVQHHHAHIVSCMAEHGLHKEVIGVAFDGTGYGTDGKIWGGEFLAASRKGFVRKAHMEYLPLPGGDRAVKEPWRMGLSYLSHAFGDGMYDAHPGFFERLNGRDVTTVLQMIRGNINSPLTSSAGRLFDAVSSIIGLRDRITFEGEAAIALETAAYSSIDRRGLAYPYRIAGGIVCLSDMIKGIVEDVRQGVRVRDISFRFHLTLGTIILDASRNIREDSGIEDVALSGGVFQNRLLLTLTRDMLEDGGFRVWSQEKVPANDGGVSLGQAVIAWERMKEEG